MLHSHRARSDRIATMMRHMNIVNIHEVEVHVEQEIMVTHADGVAG